MKRILEERFSQIHFSPTTLQLEWRGWCVRTSRDVSSEPVRAQNLLEEGQPRPNATLLQISLPKGPASMVQLRRASGKYLQHLHENFEALAPILTKSPYSMSEGILQQVKNCHDICSLVRRMAGRNGVQFHPSVAMDCIMLNSRLEGWYNRERATSLAV